MSEIPEGFIAYKRREFCKQIECPVQMELNKHEEGSEEYENTRLACKNDCKFTAHGFHQWLIDRGYIIIRPADK